MREDAWNKIWTAILDERLNLQNISSSVMRKHHISGQSDRMDEDTAAPSEHTVPATSMRKPSGRQVDENTEEMAVEIPDTRNGMGVCESRITDMQDQGNRMELTLAPMGGHVRLFLKPSSESGQLRFEIIKIRSLPEA
ncbi:hypothetical protein C7445_10329 [Alicyclobacillus sacchari]|uniref:Uncharacterized protein n=1 Tax=Alicyclobacillus sacchari TaxID=392010 RepID=A0A4R8LTQ3_9BACL|nr:hypothetical protein [Alicyclobacillus sacchari]TDY49986.1 hypothetical protein C7445_10329 [Alicyclobacillus sacchari]GMA57702.1 hypothetical protein GCM10025858_22050 [Alicyclobacillus sacchari]